MARRPSFKVRKTAHGWTINVPSGLSGSGKRERHFHETKEKATAHASRLRDQYRSFGEASATIRPSLAEAATSAEKILEPWGISLVEAARMVARLKEAEATSKVLEEAVDAWLLACEGLRPRTLDGYRQTARLLKTHLAGKVLTSITSDHLQDAVAPLGSTGAATRGRIRNSKAFWRWAAKKGWCDIKVFDGVETPKSGRDHGEIAILTPTTAAHLLATVEAYYPAAVASYALQLFAGIRTEELRRLETQHVSPEGIELPAEVTKRGRRRHITPSPTLKAWLVEYPFQPCANWREVDKACRRLSGWDLGSRLLEARDDFEMLPKPTLGKWPQNALRHSHASYAVAVGVPLESLLFEFGHAGSPAVLREHYVGRASRKEAIAFFAIGPNGSAIQSVVAA